MDHLLQIILTKKAGIQQENENQVNQDHAGRGDGDGIIYFCSESVEHNSSCDCRLRYSEGKRPVCFLNTLQK